MKRYICIETEIKQRQAVKPAPLTSWIKESKITKKEGRICNKTQFFCKVNVQRK